MLDGLTVYLTIRQRSRNAFLITSEAISSWHCVISIQGKHPDFQKDERMDGRREEGKERGDRKTEREEVGVMRETADLSL